MITTSDKNTATLLHISTLAQYFIPLGNIIFPTIIWSLKKNESEFIDKNGKHAINFQLSLLLYTFTLLLIAIPLFIYTLINSFNFEIINSDTCNRFINQFNASDITGIALAAVIPALLLIGIKILEFCLIVYAAVKNSNGETYSYPLTINFIR